MLHYKPRENIQAAYWPDESGAGETTVNTGRRSFYLFKYSLKCSLS